MFQKDQANGKKLKQRRVVFTSWDEGSTYVKKPPFFDNLIR
jgi:aconitase A